MLKKERRYNNILFPVLLVCGFFYSLPTIAMMCSAMKGEKGIMADTGLFPKRIDMSALSDVLSSNYFQNSLKNSTVIALWVCLFCVSIAVLTGYVLSRNRDRGFQAYYILLLVLQMFPLTLRLFPLFKIFKSMNILNTHLSLMLTYTGINLPFSALTMKAFFDTIPYDIEESAMVDGCGYFQRLVKIVLPVSLAGIATVSIFTFLNVWNEYMFANVFVNDPDLIPFTVSLQQYVTQNESQWAHLMSASTFGILPSILFMVFAQKYIVKGLTSGAVKG